jgi:fucose permease
MPAPQRNEVALVYVAGLAQGLALVTFPAAASVLTSPEEYGLSSTEYGAMFVPQAILAIVASLMAARFTGRLGLKRVLLFGLAADTVAMGLLVASQVGMGDPLGYAMLLLATASLGAGFGTTVPSLNTYAAALLPQVVDRAVLVLNALLGLGTALAPILAAIFLGLGLWWGLPAGVGLLLLVVLAIASRLLTEPGGAASGAGAGAEGRPMPARIWIYLGFALLYGVVETMNGNWATVYMGADVGASAAAATLALAAFWGTVTVGRLLFAAIERWLPEARIFRILPFVAAVALLAVAALPAGGVALGVLAFGLAGLGCSALLPLTISFGEQELAVIAASVAGFLIAAYQVGYGIAAFAVGPLESAGIGLSTIYAATAIVAVAMGVIATRVVAGRPAEARA